MSETIHAKPKLKQLITTLCISAVNRNSITPIPDLRPSLSNYGIVNNIKVIEGNVFAYMANEFECLKVIKALDKSRLGGLEIEMAFAFHRSQQHSMFLRKHNPDFLKLCAEHIDMKLKYKILKRKELEGALPSIDDLVNEHFNKKSKSVCFDNFECVLVSIGPDTRDYELAMIKNIKTIGIKYTVEHINNDASLITNLIDEAVRSSVHFVIAIDKNNENFKSMTLYLLSKEQRQEHRNMPIDMGIEMLKSKFNLYKDQRPKVANKLAVVSKNNFIAKKNIIPNNVRHSGIGIQSNNQHHNQQNKFDQQNIPRNLTKEKASLLFRFLASGKLLHSVDLSSLMNYIDRLIRGNIFDNNSAPLSELTLVEIKEVERERYTKNILGLIKESSPLPPPKKSLLDSHRPMHSDNRLISPRNPRFNMYNESPRHPFQRDQRMYSNINPRKRMYPSAPNYY